MHKVFGDKKRTDYVDRKGAYLIAVKDGKIAVIKTAKGYFLLGGGSDCGETDEETIIRECLEETGCGAVIDRLVCSAETYTEHPDLGCFHPIQSYYSGTLLPQNQKPSETDHQLVWTEYDELQGNLFAEMQNWALDEWYRIYYK